MSSSGSHSRISVYIIEIRAGAHPSTVGGACVWSLRTTRHGKALKLSPGRDNNDSREPACPLHADAHRDRRAGARQSQSPPRAAGRGAVPSY